MYITEFGGTLGCQTVPVVTVSVSLRMGESIMGNRISNPCGAICKKSTTETDFTRNQSFVDKLLLEKIHSRVLLESSVCQVWLQKYVNQKFNVHGEKKRDAPYSVMKCGRLWVQTIAIVSCDCWPCLRSRQWASNLLFSNRCRFLGSIVPANDMSTETPFCTIRSAVVEKHFLFEGIKGRCILTCLGLPKEVPLYHRLRGGETAKYVQRYSGAARTRGTEMLTRPSPTCQILKISPSRPPRARPAPIRHPIRIIIPTTPSALAMYSPPTGRCERLQIALVIGLY